MRMGRGHCQLQVCSWGVDLQPGRSHLQLMARLQAGRGRPARGALLGSAVTLEPLPPCLTGSLSSESGPYTGPPSVTTVPSMSLSSLKSHETVTSLQSRMGEAPRWHHCPLCTPHIVPTDPLPAHCSSTSRPALCCVPCLGHLRHPSLLSLTSYCASPGQPQSCSPLAATAPRTR